MPKWKLLKSEPRRVLKNTPRSHSGRNSTSFSSKHPTSIIPTNVFGGASSADVPAGAKPYAPELLWSSTHLLQVKKDPWPTHGASQLAKVPTWRTTTSPRRSPGWRLEDVKLKETVISSGWAKILWVTFPSNTYFMFSAFYSSILK